jgi:hypothetical protein
MDFSVNLLDTLVSCDNALLVANKRQADLEFKQLSLNRAFAESLESASLAQTELIASQAELASTLQAIESLPPGKTEDDLIKRKLQLDLKIFTLTKRVESPGVSSILTQQYDINVIAHELELNASLIALINARKTELASTAA